MPVARPVPRPLGRSKLSGQRRTATPYGLLATAHLVIRMGGSQVPKFLRNRMVTVAIGQSFPESYKVNNTLPQVSGIGVRACFRQSRARKEAVGVEIGGII